MRTVTSVFASCLFLSTANFSIANAQEAEEIIIVGVTPNGTGLERDKIPFPIQTATSDDIQNSNSLSIADFLRQNFSSVSVNNAQSNPLQPDVQYRGFTASPLLGLAQGIAVYQNGVRVNEPLGDTVNWDLVPESAINGITLSGGSNPLFGLNTLGGALLIDMKNGFNYEGREIEINTGSFGRNTASLQTGNNFDNGDNSFAYYANLQFFEEDGWRDYSSSESINFYGSLDWQNQSSSLVSIINGPGLPYSVTVPHPWNY